MPFPTIISIMLQSNISPKKISVSVLKFLTVLAFWIAVWCLLSWRINNDFLFPSPLAVIKELGTLIGEKSFWVISLTSLFRVLLGTVVSIVIGIILGVITSHSKVLDLLISPLMSVIKSTPVASFIILACVWLNRDILPIFITSLIVIPIVWSNISEGFSSVDKNLKDVTRVYRFSFAKKVYRLYIPSVLPYFFAACKSSLGMAWKAGIAAEILAVPQNSIGTELYYAKTYFETTTMFAWTLIIIVLSMIFEKLFVFSLERLGNRLHVVAKGGVRNAEGQ